MDANLRRAIHYELSYEGDDSGTRETIVAVLARLPEEVREWALDRCRFLSVGGTLAAYPVPGRLVVDPATRRSRGVWLIVIDDRAEDLEGVIAHELAHVWLRRAGTGSIGGFDAWEAEEEAAEALAHVWGFTGPGTDASSKHLPVP
jgi:AcrR family transcriptional regulator